jgi:biotin carboxylase
MKRPVAILLGGNKLHRGVVDKLHERGMKVIVVDWNPEPELKGDHHVRVDAKDTGRVLKAIAQLGQMDVHVAYTSIDVAVPTAAAIHKRYGLCAPQGARYEAPLSKAQMAAVWNEHKLLNRFSLLIPPGQQQMLNAAARGKEVIVKPNVSSCSRGITILSAGADETTLRTALDRAQGCSFDGQAVVEEFFHGREFSVEMLGDSEGNVAVYAVAVKYHTLHAGPNRVANKLHYNSTVYPDETYDRIAEYGRRCYRSLGLNCSFGHLEILIREDGLLSPVEIGARSGGFIVHPLVPVVSGRDFLEDYLGVLRGARVANESYRTSMSSMYFFYDFPPDRPCRNATHLCEHLPTGIESLYHDREAIDRGRTYRTIDNDTERHGHEILCGHRSTLTIKAVETAERRMLRTLFNGSEG